jgi:hypothetical protein
LDSSALPIQFKTSILPVDAKEKGGVELVLGYEKFDPLLKYAKYSYPSKF